MFDTVNETVTYPVDRLSFWLVAVGGSFIVLLLIKNLRMKGKQ